MITGTVKFFNADKGYGFIAPDGGGQDAFVHITALESSGINTLNMRRLLLMSHNPNIELRTKGSHPPRYHRPI